MSSLIETFWYKSHPLRWLFWPFSFLFLAVATMRRSYYQGFAQYKSSIPVIVVGNLSVGGTGKTPLVIALAKKLCDKGLKPAIVSRGYGARLKQFPYQIKQGDCAKDVGDEPLLIARKTGCPVIIAPKRKQALHYLEKHQCCDVVISDDGLQHYAMGRAIEIMVIDGMRGLGNGLCLPAGPLREPKKRLKEADFIVVNDGLWPDAYTMHLKVEKLIHLQSGNDFPIAQVSEKVAAVAGIGHPERFYRTLNQQGIHFATYTFADHYNYQSGDLKFNEKMIIMTEKDAVKCQAFASEDMYFLSVEAALTDAFWDRFFENLRLKGINNDTVF